MMTSSKPHASFKRSHPYTVMVTNRTGLRQVYRKQGGGFTISEGRAHRTPHGYPSGNFNHAQLTKIKQKARAKGWQVRINHGRSYPWVQLQPGEKWPQDRHTHKLNHTLLHRLNEAGRSIHRGMWIQSGFRSYADQAALYASLPAGVANPPWILDDHRTGEAADVSVIASNGHRWNLGQHPKFKDHGQHALAKFGLYLPYRWPHGNARGTNEIWHVEALHHWRHKLPTQSHN